MLSNVTEPMIGVVNSAVIGQLPGAYYIGAITVGALIFNFITVDAEQSIGDQHHQIRELFLEGQRRPWTRWNTDAVAEWLLQRDTTR